MINYGRLLLSKEKDNPSQILRATYIFSNAGTLIHCYGRSMRFPLDRILYMAEMKLAIGDILMQCRMLLEENRLKPIKIANLDTGGISELEEIQIISENAANTMHKELQVESALQLIISCYALCILYEWNPEDVEHLGYQHVIERFEQFERDEWR